MATTVWVSLFAPAGLSDGGFSSESVSNTPEKSRNGDTNGMSRGGPSLLPCIIVGSLNLWEKQFSF